MVFLLLVLSALPNIVPDLSQKIVSKTVCVTASQAWVESVSTCLNTR